MKKLIDLIDQQIAVLQANIDRHKGVGPYQETCRIWGYHIDAYRQLRDLVVEQRKTIPPRT